MTTTSVRPRRASWYAMDRPMTPAPTIAISARAGRGASELSRPSSVRRPPSPISAPGGASRVVLAEIGQDAERRRLERRSRGERRHRTGAHRGQLGQETRDQGLALLALAGAGAEASVALDLLDVGGAEPGGAGHGRPVE